MFHLHDSHPSVARAHRSPPSSPRRRAVPFGGLKRTRTVLGRSRPPFFTSRLAQRAMTLRTLARAVAHLRSRRPRVLRSVATPGIVARASSVRSSDFHAVRSSSGTSSIASSLARHARVGRRQRVDEKILCRGFASARDGEDDDGFADDLEDVAESFYVGSVECVADVMIIDEDGNEPREVMENGLDLNELRVQVEEDARAVMTKLLTSRGDSAGGKAARGALPRSVSHMELSVALCSDEYIRSLNAGYRQKDSATDVLSFPAESFGPMAVLGDVVVSVDTAATQAREVGHSLRDECRVLLVHGLLHLLGLDHELGEDEAEAMAEAEREMLSELGWKVTGLTTRGSEVDETSTSSSRSSSTQRSILVTDLDGTLLNEESVISPGVADALRRAIAAGVEVIIATGKARPAAIRAASTQGLDGIIVGKNTPGVFLQGLEVYGRGGELVYEAKMPEDVVRDAFMMMDDVVHDGLALTAFCGDTCATLEDNVLLDVLHHTFHEPKSDVVASVDDILSVRSVRKLLLMGPSKESINAVRPIWEAAFKGRAEITQAVADMLEIIPMGNNKAKGVMKVLKSMNINPATDVVACGDGENDAEMLKIIGCGVAMANGSEKTKKDAAHVLEESNEQDGVAVAIDRFVL